MEEIILKKKADHDAAAELASSINEFVKGAIEYLFVFLDYKKKWPVKHGEKAVTLFYDFTRQDLCEIIDDAVRINELLDSISASARAELAANFPDELRDYSLLVNGIYRCLNIQSLAISDDGFKLNHRIAEALNYGANRNSTSIS